MIAAAIFSALLSAPDAKAVFKKASPSIVYVSSAKSTGTGFVIGDGTIVVTCYHVIDDSIDKPWMIEVNGNPISKVLSFKDEPDIAILKITSPIPALKLRDGIAEPGEKVFAIGYPLGLADLTISEGIVSALRKLTARTYVSTTAAVSGGSSGGPLLDEDGCVIGIIESTLTKGQQNNLAISVQDALPVITAGLSAPAKPTPRPSPAPPRKEPRASPEPSKALTGTQAAERARSMIGFSCDKDVALQKQFLHCGFTQYILGLVGKKIPIGHDNQILTGAPVKRLEDLLAGDRLYFYVSEKSPYWSGIYLRNGNFVRYDQKTKMVVSSYLGDKQFLECLVAARRDK